MSSLGVRTLQREEEFVAIGLVCGFFALGQECAHLLRALRLRSYSLLYSPPYAYVNLFPTMRPITRER